MTVNCTSLAKQEDFKIDIDNIGILKAMTNRNYSKIKESC